MKLNPGVIHKKVGSDFLGETFRVAKGKEAPFWVRGRTQ
jgi:hypothetical protein